MGDLYLASDKRYEKMVYNRVGKRVSNFRQFLLVSGTILEARTTMTT